MPTDAPAQWWADAMSVDSVRAYETAADRRLYLEVGLAPVTCRHCGTEVLVKKNSAKHTSVQWRTDPYTTCPEFAAAARDGAPGVRIPGCPRLKASIAAAAAAGQLVVPGD